MTVARRVVIAGRVQGVGFRESLVDVAQRERVAGWVRNVRDGTVEALLQGEEAVVARVIAWCHRGPPSAQVAHVEVSSVEPDPAITRFARRPTA